MTNNTRDRNGWIYFLRSGDAIKIGFSMEPKRRLETLQISHHVELEMLAMVSTDIIREGETHARFAHLRLRGEWFRAEPELLTYIENLQGRINLTERKRNSEPVRKEPVRRELVPRELVPRRTPSPDLEALRADLAIMRDRHGADSPIGHHCTNILEQLVALETYVRPAWATDERQTLQWGIKRQIAGLAHLTGGMHQPERAAQSGRRR